MAYTEKKINRGKRFEKNEKIINKLSLSVLINLIKYTLCDSEYISDRNISNLKKLIDSIDENHSYDSENDGLMLEYFHLLKEILKLYFEMEVSLNDVKDIIEERCEESYISKNTLETVFTDVFSEEFSDKNVLYWNKWVQDKLDYFSLYKDLDELQKVIDAFKVPDLKMDSVKLIPQAREIIQNIARQLANNKSLDTSKLNMFDPTSSDCKIVVKNSLDSCLNVGNKLSTGYQRLDKMLNGGFENGRCYLLVGIPKHFKSGTMLNLVLNIACNCKNWITKNPDTIPCVLYYTMENSLNETLERVYSYLGIPFDFEYTIKKNKYGFESKEYHLTDEEINSVIQTIQEETMKKTGVCLLIQYEGRRNIDTSIFYQIYDDLLVQGKELIFIAQDYIKKIRSVQPAPDIRYELGYVVDEFCLFAKDKNIPFLTIHQFNREGVRVSESAKTEKKKDLGRKLNASMVGDSNLVIENADVSLAVDREFDEETQQTYQTFSLMMSRVKTDPNLHYFAQPFDPDPKYRNFKIAVDIDLPEPLGIDKISNISEAKDVKVRDSSNDAIKNRRDRKIKATMDIRNILEENLDENERIMDNIKDFEDCDEEFD